MTNLALVGVADADHRLFDGVGCVFADGHTGTRGHQHGDGPRLPELERCRAILADEGLLDGCSVGQVRGPNRVQLIEKRDQT